MYTAKIPIPAVKATGSAEALSEDIAYTLPTTINSGPSLPPGRRHQLKIPTAKNDATYTARSAPELGAYKSTELRETVKPVKTAATTPIHPTPT
jgi:hypothetical protein